MATGRFDGGHTARWSTPPRRARFSASATWARWVAIPDQAEGTAPGEVLTCGLVVEPPAGIEPATPSLPWTRLSFAAAPTDRDGPRETATDQGRAAWSPMLPRPAM